VSHAHDFAVDREDQHAIDVLTRPPEHPRPRSPVELGSINTLQRTSNSTLSEAAVVAVEEAPLCAQLSQQRLWQIGSPISKLPEI